MLRRRTPGRVQSLCNTPNAGPAPKRRDPYSAAASDVEGLVFEPEQIHAIERSP